MTTVSGSADGPGQVGLGSVDSLHPLPRVAFNGSPNGLGETSVGTTPAYSGGGYVAYNTMLNDTLSWIKGRHTLKFGGEFRAL